MAIQNFTLLLILKKVMSQGQNQFLFNGVLTGVIGFACVMLQDFYRWNVVLYPVFNLIVFAALAIPLGRLLPFPKVQLVRRDIFVMRSLWLVSLVLVACLVAFMLWAGPLTANLLIKSTLGCLAPAWLGCLRYSQITDNR
jgi:hypothetical protein